MIRVANSSMPGAPMMIERRELGKVAHELKDHYTAILAAADAIITTGDYPPEADEMLAIIINSARRGAATLDELVRAAPDRG